MEGNFYRLTATYTYLLSSIVRMDESECTSMSYLSTFFFIIDILNQVDRVPLQSGVTRQRGNVQEKS